MAFLMAKRLERCGRSMSVKVSPLQVRHANPATNAWWSFNLLVPTLPTKIDFRDCFRCELAGSLPDLNTIHQLGLPKIYTNASSISSQLCNQSSSAACASATRDRSRHGATSDRPSIETASLPSATHKQTESCSACARCHRSRHESAAACHSNLWRSEPVSSCDNLPDYFAVCP